MELDISYSASIISNGTCWPDDVPAFIRRHRIRQVQISFDGLKENHDKRRRYRRGRSPEPGISSFEQAVAVVDQLLDVVRVDLRFNTDRGNHSDLEGFIGFSRARGGSTGPSLAFSNWPASRITRSGRIFSAAPSSRRGSSKEFVNARALWCRKPLSTRRRPVPPTRCRGPRSVPPWPRIRSSLGQMGITTGAVSRLARRTVPS